MSEVEDAQVSPNHVGVEIFEKDVTLDSPNLLEESTTDDNLSDLSDDPELVFSNYVTDQRGSLKQGSELPCRVYDDVEQLNFVNSYMNCDKFKIPKISCSSEDDLDDVQKEEVNGEEDKVIKTDCVTVDGYESTDSDEQRPAAEAKSSKKNLKSQIKNLLTATSQHKRKKCFYLFDEGLVELCKLSNTEFHWIENLKPKYIKWEPHQLILDRDQIRAAKATGYMEFPISYSSVEDVHIISRWDAGQKFCIRVTIQDGSLLLQANNSHLRDQWLHSIQWKKHMYKYEKLLKNARRPEVLVKEIKNMIDVSLHTPIQDPSVYQFPLDLVSELLQRNADVITKVAHENIIVALAPLLENNHPTQEICDFFSKHCKNSPRSSIVIELFTPVVQRILKHNMDFGKFPRMRQFVMEYIQALNCQNAGLEVVKEFIRSMHGPASVCPHPRVLPNLVAVCLAAVYCLYEDRKLAKQDNMAANQFDQSEWERRVVCYIGMMETMSTFEDWRYILGSLLQPIPFPNDSLADDLFTSNMKNVIRNLATDKVCEVHQTILGIREGKEGWFHLYCPGNIGCDDDGELWGQMLKTLMHCCCKRKYFLYGLNKMIGPVMLLSLRENTAAMEVLCAMLECDVVENNDLKMQMVTTLQSTISGKHMYADLCERQIALRELQQKGGPKKLTLPSKSTDTDLAKMLSSGSFGNLECLSLAFTQVTSACADDLIKLPSLRYLNLWSTQFGDVGLQKISEHLHKLQVLNLCETPVTDKGLSSIAALKNLRKLNLNSTNLSALVFEGLKEKLPALQECDVRYTDAW